MGIKRMPPAAVPFELGTAAYRNLLETPANVSGELPAVSNGDPVMGVRLPDAAVNADITAGLAVLPTYKKRGPPPPDEKKHPESDKTTRARSELIKTGTAFFMNPPTVNGPLIMAECAETPRGWSVRSSSVLLVAMQPILGKKFSIARDSLDSPPDSCNADNRARLAALLLGTLDSRV
ncbi:MAG TPA: hypothetical protein VMT05_01395 [Terriglobales bacterium]|nr:hypothetical protein [Terriglobales bacterium]